MPEQRQRGRCVPPTSVAGGLPSTAIQRQVAGAVHQAICALLKTDGSDRCAWYAATAANLMPHLTGNKYTINSGSLTVATEPNGNGFTFDAANPQIADAEFHSLLVRDHGNGRFEAADLAARHWRIWARRLGARWRAPEPPPFIWGWFDEFDQMWPLGISFAIDLDLTNRHLAYIANGPGAPLLRQLSGYALRIIKGG
jgi:hypothetical protein